MFTILIFEKKNIHGGSRVCGLGASCTGVVISLDFDPGPGEESRRGSKKSMLTLQGS